MPVLNAPVAELVYATALKAVEHLAHMGSNPIRRTIQKSNI